MKILYSPIQSQTTIYKYTSSPVIAKDNRKNNDVLPNIQNFMLYNINFPNVSFKMNADAKFLLNQTDHLLCAYSGKEMISPQLAKK